MKHVKKEKEKQGSMTHTQGKNKIVKLPLNDSNWCT